MINTVTALNMTVKALEQAFRQGREAFAKEIAQQARRGNVKHAYDCAESNVWDLVVAPHIEKTFGGDCQIEVNAAFDRLHFYANYELIAEAVMAA